MKIRYRLSTGLMGGGFVVYAEKYDYEVGCLEMDDDPFPSRILAVAAPDLYRSYMRGNGPHTNSIYQLKVDKDYRRRGIASRMMRLFLAKSEAEGFDALVLKCWPDGSGGPGVDDLVRFYASFGFVETGVKDGDAPYMLRFAGE